MSKETTINKLRKLLRQQKGEEALGNIEAGAAFGAKIAELLTKHKLEFGEITEEEERANPLIYIWVSPEEWGEATLGKRVQFSEELAAGIAPYYFCQGLADLESNRVLFAGRSGDVEICRAIFLRLMRLGVALCEVELAGEIARIEDDSLEQMLWRFYNSNTKFRRSFLAGYNFKIKERLQMEKERIESNAGDCTALVRATKDVEKFVDTVLNPNKDAPNFEQSLDNRAFTMGRKHGESVQLRPNALSE